MAEGGLPDIVAAHRLSGLVYLHAGAFSDARMHLEEAIRIYNPGWNSVTKLHHALDSGITATAYLAHVCWQFGEVTRARELIDQATARADDLAHIPTLANTRFFKAMLGMFRDDAESTARDADALIEIATSNGLALYLIEGETYRAWARAGLGDREAGRAEMRHALAKRVEAGMRASMPYLLGKLAELDAECQSADEAAAHINEALAIAGETGERWTDALLHCIRGDILFKADSENPAHGEEAYLVAIAIARERGARSFGLQAALKLAKLDQSIGRPAEAHAVLAPALEGFSPTREMTEIGAAQALLAALAETDEVKAETPRRARLAQLQVAYGNALFAARGYGAPETTEAFARAGESASGPKDEPERLAADYGLWVGSFARGELGAMRELSATMLRDCERRPQSGEASVAHRMRGVTHWFAGEFVAARGHLEQAAAIFDPERDGDLAFRFGLDPGIVATAYLAQVLWLLGEVGLAGQRMKETTARAAKSRHVTTNAYGFFMAAQFELFRRNPDSAAPFVKSLIEVANEHQLAFWMTYSGWFEGWLEWRTGNRDAGLSRMRDTAARQADKGIIPATTFFETTLAEAEAGADETNAAFCTINRALAVSERTGLRWYEAETHRIRGEILLKRDPGDASPAEEAFLTAIAVAQAQKARSFELRAALTLAKLYQSTARPADAHAALVPALKGFTPTPEMPEIAEALETIAAIEAGAHLWDGLN
jgi:predicted ATPase